MKAIMTLFGMIFIISLKHYQIWMILNERRNKTIFCMSKVRSNTINKEIEKIIYNNDVSHETIASLKEAYENLYGGQKK